MVKSYLKYEQARSFGTITSGTTNVIWNSDPRPSASTGSGRVYTAANENILCWDLKKGELLHRWSDAGCNASATAIARGNVDTEIFAVGYEDGSIRLWDSRIGTVLVKFNGHRSAITTLAFDSSGVRLASGSRDTDIIVWDLVAEVGLFRLRGHKDRITGLQFLHNVPRSTGEEDVSLDDDKFQNYLLSTSKDSLIKLWDVASQYCIETHVAQSNGECWSLAISPDGSGCITTGKDGEMTVWTIHLQGLGALAQKVDQKDEQYIQRRGVLHRQIKGSAIEIKFHPKLDYFALHGSEKAVEIWRIRTSEEIRKVLARKRRRKREKQPLDKSDPVKDEQVDEEEGTQHDAAPTITDHFVSHTIIRTGGKVRSFDWVLNKSTKKITLTTSLTTNQLEVWDVPTKENSRNNIDADSLDYSRSLAVDMPGHRADIRTLALSSDDRMLATASNGGLKIWNIRTSTCIRTFDCGYALCSAFLPGDKVVVVGTKTGELELFDVVSAALIESVKAHDSAIWSLQVHPDGRSLVSGSADKSAKLWNFQVVQEEIPGTRRTTPKLTLVHTRTLKVTDDILSVRFTPDARLLAVALLDNTVKVFFLDSLKLYLNLYGHKLPVLHMDISYDNKLIVTCSADKTIRIWGLDFGDCHKALYGHSDSILQVGFVSHNQDGNGHHVFSCSKDRTIRYWDADKFEQIQRLDGHHGEIWAMAVSRTGDFIVTAAHDKSIRVWEQTEEQIFLEEEREKQMEELYESTLTASLEADAAAPTDGDAEGGTEVGAAGKQTIETLMAGERIAEALELGMADLEVMHEHGQLLRTNPHAAPPARNPIFTALGGISAEAYVYSVIRKIHAAALHDALLVLPFSQVPALFTFLARWAEGPETTTNGTQPAIAAGHGGAGADIALTCRVLFFMLGVHRRSIIASGELKVLLDRVRTALRVNLAASKDEMGFNLAALRILHRSVVERTEKGFVDGEDQQLVAANGVDGGRGVKKRAFVQVA